MSVPPAWLRRLQPIARDERGMSIIELAIVMPFLSLLLIGIVELSMGFSKRLQTEQAVFRTLELAHIRGDATDLTLLKNEAAQAAGVPPARVTVINDLYCDGAKRAQFDGVCSAGQSTSRYVKITVETAYEPIFSGPATKFFTNANPDGSIPLTAEAAVRMQ